MGNDKTPLTSEKQYTYKGVFDLKSTYKYIKEFLSNSRHYDVSEKDLVETNDGGKKSIVAKLQAELEYTDYFKIFINFEIDMDGKEVIVEDKSGNSKKMVDGTAKITVNAYLQTDYNKQIQKGPLATFLRKAYDSYLGQDEIGKAAEVAFKDVGELVRRFKQAVNSTL